MSTKRTPSEKIRLKPADSFDLIRLIARSQSDPRKAVAELVQNSLDAGATMVQLTWFSRDKARCLSVHDNGRGVFPELPRDEALRRLATSIGASHKAQLSPLERHRQMTLGKYGIGLLGFWSVGRHMEIRSRVGGSDAWVLKLEEEVRDAVVERPRASRLPLDETFTEVVVTGVHPAAEAQIKPRRLAAYLAGELRGQLLARDVRLEIHDHIARGLAEKLLVVRPQKYQGVLIESLSVLDVAGYETARVEIYLIPEGAERRGLVTLACGGATVLDDMAHVEGHDAQRAPWSSGRFEGVIDFPDLHVAPSTRRGYVPNAASQALLEALPQLEDSLRAVLAEEEERLREERNNEDAKDLRRLFRPLARLLPEYVFFDVKDDLPAPGAAPSEGEPMPGGEAPPGVDPEAVAGDEQDEEPLLFPPGPLATLSLKPRRSTLLPESTRTIRATAKDADGRKLIEGVTFSWGLDGRGEFVADGATCTYTAPREPGRAHVVVEAQQGELLVEARALINISDDAEPERGQRSGIPDPEPFPAPGEPWRSRVLEGAWNFNVDHPDYLLVQDDPKRRLRYLAHLFAKEVVLRNFGDPSDSAKLERMVEVIVRLDDATSRKGR